MNEDEEREIISSMVIVVFCLISTIILILLGLIFGIVTITKI